MLLLGPTFSQAQQFTTGSQDGGYLLRGVGLKLNSQTSNFSGLTVSIYSSVSDAPGSSQHTLTNPTGTVAAGSEAIFTISPSVTLAADTSYFVVVASSTTRNDFFNVTTSNSEDAGASTGWSIGNERYFRNPQSGSVWASGTPNLMMSIYPPNTAATGQPKIEGTPQVGQVLKAIQNTIDDSDGFPDNFPDDYDIQWVRVDGSNETDISERDL